MSLPRIHLDRIKAEAANLGFSLFGVSKPSALQKIHVFQNWLDKGFHAEMRYLSRPESVVKRFSPDQLVANCRSVISLGFPYPLINFQDLPGSLTSGWISAYAVSKDYHSILIEHAQKLISKIQSSIDGDYTFQAFTDSTPILEREFGVLSGLGWIGKNANLISPIVGSHFLLAEIFTDLELDAEQASVPDRCGKCRRCMDSCPTACIQLDRTIDARKCISYLTIENKQAIPFEVRGKIGRWVFGCDICQAVCPWNSVSQKSDKRMENHAISPLVKLPEQICFSENEFKEFYSQTPVLRVGWMGFLRNLIITAGNLKDLESLPLLINLLEGHPVAMVRSHAAWALGQYQSSVSQAALTKALVTEHDPSVKTEIQSVLIQ